MLQWGIGSKISGANKTITVTFPMAFSTSIFCIVSSWKGSTDVDDNCLCHTYTITNFKVKSSQCGANDGSWSLYAAYIAIGC